jgi:hypothetical protein
MPKATYKPFDLEAAVAAMREGGVSYSGPVIVLDDLSAEEVEALDQRAKRRPGLNLS